MLTLKDNSVITLDKMSPALVQKTKEYLEKLKQGKSSKYTAAHFKEVAKLCWRFTARLRKR